MGAIVGLPVLAWAKPVPVNPIRLHKPRRDMLYVSLAGPGHQLPAHGRCGARRAKRCSIRRRCRRASRSSTCRSACGSCSTFALVNLFLGLFNLLPIPPLDGSSLIERVLPGQLAAELVQVPALRVPRAVPARVLHRGDLAVPAAVRGLARTVGVRMNVDEARAPRRVASCARSRPRRRRADDVAWVETVLTPDGFALFRRQPNHDQRHAIGVARDVQARLADTPYADDPRWLSAALLHDIGKLDSHLGVYGRVVATVVGRGGRAGPRRGVVGVDGASPGASGVYLRHAELGADRIRIAGEPEEAALWAAAHHDPSTWRRAPHPAPTSSPRSTRPTTTSRRRSDRTSRRRGVRNCPDEELRREDQEPRQQPEPGSADAIGIESTNTTRAPATRSSQLRNTSVVAGASAGARACCACQNIAASRKLANAERDGVEHDHHGSASP